MQRFGDGRREKKFGFFFINPPISQVFKQLEKLPKLTEFEKSQLKIYKPSFSKQELNYDKYNFGPLGR